MYIDKEELLELLKEKYGQLNNDCGCYCRNGEWLSISAIVDVIDECDEYGAEDF